MSNELLIAIFTGLGAMFAWGTADFFAKKSVDKIGDYSTLFWSQLIGIVPLSVFILLTNDIHTLTVFDFTIILGLGLLDMISWVYFYKALEKGEVSLLSPVFATWAGGAVIMSAFIFGEIVPLFRWISLSIIFIGVILISFDFGIFRKKTKDKLIKGLPEVIFATLFFSLWVALWGHYINGRPWVFITLLMRTVVVLLLFIACRVKKVPLKVEGIRNWSLLIYVGIFELSAYSLVSYGFSKTSFVSIVAMLSGAFSLPTIILGRIFLKEKMTKIQAVGGIVIIFGIMILSLV